ncbi:MAG: MarR family transcriptional regulator [Pirellulales bacterium]|nr:MarR family transcriptional regulator [Pirellulales bacterium]
MSSPTRPLVFDSAAQEAFLNLWRTYDRLRVLEEELFARHHLTAQQYNALRILKAAAPEMLPTLSLAAKLISRAPDITRLIDHLVAHGWAVRDRRPENRRVVQVGILHAGNELLDKIHEEVRQVNQRQLGHLSPEEQRQLIHLLKLARQPHEPEESAWR